MQAERDEILKTFAAAFERFREFQKSRTERERSETFSDQIGNLATQMLPVLDNLNRALDLRSMYARRETAGDSSSFSMASSLVTSRSTKFLPDGRPADPTVGEDV